MTKWQRWARLLVAIFAVGFAVMVALAFKRRAPVVEPGLSGRTDPNAVVDSVQDARCIELEIAIQRDVDHLAAMAADEQLIDHKGRFRDDDAVAVLDEQEHQRLQHIVETCASNNAIRRYARVASDCIA